MPVAKRVMAEAGNPVLYILTVVFVAMVGLFGLFAMFAQASNVERNFLVGGLTVLTSVVAVGMLASLAPASHTGPVLTSIAFVSLFGYGVGRIIDFLMGPRAVEPPEMQEPVLGADLAD